MSMRFVDLHCDTIGESIARYDGKVTLKNSTGHVNIAKLQEGGALAQFFAIFIPTNSERKKYHITVTPYEYFNQVYDVYLQEMAANRDVILPAMNYSDVTANRIAGKISSILTIEDGVPVDGKMERLDEFYQKGVRLITLTWNYENSFGFPNSLDPAKNALHLKPFGIEAIRRMNDLGILIDVSHLNDAGFYDVANCSQKPFMASHSCARALCSHSRCMTDDMLHKLGEKSSVIGINFCAAFLSKDSKHTSIHDILRHALHIRDKAGIDAVALGSDFDGIGSKLEFKDYTGMPLIADALSRHFTSSEVEKICSGNALRVIQESMK